MAQTAWDYWSAMSDPARKYYIKKGAVPGDTSINLRKQTPEWLMGQINQTLQKKGAAPIADFSQVESATSPLVAQRNKRGAGGLLGTALSVGLPLIGSAFGPVGAAAGGALGGLATGGGVKGALMNALMSGAGSALSTYGGSILGDVAKAGKVGGGSAGTGILGAMTRGGGTLADIGYGVNKGLNTITGIGRDVASGIGLGSTGFSGLGKGGMGTATGATGMSRITSGNPLAMALSGWQQYQTQSDMEEQLRNAQNQAMAALNPYMQTGYQANRQLSDALAAGFDPSNIETDPGYQFRLREGQKQLEQSLAARGLGQSGAALKAAQQYGQDFARNEYADAYNRWLANNAQLAGQSGQGAGLAGQAGNIYTNLGNIGANATAGRNNALMSALSGVLSGGGIVGWDLNGNPIYG